MNVSDKLKHKILPHKITPSKLGLGQKAADGIAKWGGSWTFVLSLIAILIIWMIFNTALILLGVWDPYPFILLNLVLSCLAAFQAPIILMSQNRSAERDRRRSEYDYAINRKAEREIEDIQRDLEEIKKLIKKRNK